MILINGEFDSKQAGEGNITGNKENTTFTLNEICLSYFKYKINLIDNVPSFDFENKILENTALGYPVKFFVISNSPRILITFYH